MRLGSDAGDVQFLISNRRAVDQTPGAPEAVLVNVANSSEPATVARLSTGDDNRGTDVGVCG